MQSAQKLNIDFSSYPSTNFSVIQSFRRARHDKVSTKVYQAGSDDKKIYNHLFIPKVDCPWCKSTFSNGVAFLYHFMTSHHESTKIKTQNTNSIKTGGSLNQSVHSPLATISSFLVNDYDPDTSKNIDDDHDTNTSDNDTGTIDNDHDTDKSPATLSDKFTNDNLLKITMTMT